MGIVIYQYHIICGNNREAYITGLYFTLSPSFSKSDEWQISQHVERTLL